MPQCEICGKYTNELYTIEVEGAVLQVCKECSTKGKFIAKVREEKPKKEMIITNEQPVEELIDDYDKIIKQKRKEKNLTQEQLAKKINEQLITIKKIENGDLHPTEKQAKKFEKLFDIKLYQVIKRQSINEIEKQKKPQAITLGDIVKIKKKNKE